MSARALLSIDIQRGFDAPGWGARNSSGAEDRAAASHLHGAFCRALATDAIPTGYR